MTEKAFHLKQFEKSLLHAAPSVIEAHGRKLGGEVLAETRRNFASLLPDLPSHRTNLSRVNFSGAPTALAYYRAVSPLVSREQALSDTHSFMVAAISGIFSSEVPALVRRAMGIPAVFCLGLHILLRRDTLANDPQGWIFHLLPRQKGHLCDFDVTRCGVHRYLCENNAPELTSRAICPLDDWLSENVLAPGTRLSRETLLSRGDDHCSFRYLNPEK